MTDTLSLDQLARFTGEPKKRLLHWQSLGLIGTGDGAFRQEDIGRVRFIHDIMHHGMTAEALAQAARKPASAANRYLEEVSVLWSHPIYSVEDAAKVVGMDPGFVRRMMDAGGLRQQGEFVSGDDLDFFRACHLAVEAGYPEDALMQLLRVYADAMERVAEAEGRTTHFYLHERLKAEGLSGEHLSETVADAVRRLNRLAEPAVLYFHRKGMAKATWEDMLTHLEEDSGLMEKVDELGQIQRAIMFIDLANFTPLAEALGDTTAAQVLERFAAIVRRANVRCHGRIVKQIGDAFMVVFPESVSAVSCALEVEERAAKEPQFPPVRAGLHWGPVLYHEGDYVGSNVNIASRLGSDAKSHQILVTSEVRRRAKSLAGVEWVRLGKRRLKGLARQMEIYEVRAAGERAADRVIDPVCGMELGPEEIAARLTLDGRERAFCSDECLRKFVRDPEKYTSSGRAASG